MSLLVLPLATQLVLQKTKQVVGKPVGRDLRISSETFVVTSAIAAVDEVLEVPCACGVELMRVSTVLNSGGRGECDAQVAKFFAETMTCCCCLFMLSLFGECGIDAAVRMLIFTISLVLLWL